MSGPAPYRTGRRLGRPEPRGSFHSFELFDINLRLSLVETENVTDAQGEYEWDFRSWSGHAHADRSVVQTSARFTSPAAGSVEPGQVYVTWCLR